MSIRLNDRGEIVRRWREVMAIRFDGYKRALGELPTNTDVFGQRAVSWQREYEKRTGQAIDGVVSDNDLAALGLQKAAPVINTEKPWIITVAGHLGGWNTGPAYLSARWLEERGLVHVQPVGYDNGSIPFNNMSGFNEMDRIVNDVLPKNAPWAFESHSQGSIITSLYYEQKIKPGQDRGEKPFTNFRGGIQFGNPRRPLGVSALWVPDRPAADTEGIDPDCLDAKIPGVEEVARKGDLYADKKRDIAGDYKEAVYLAVAWAQLFGANSLTEQMGKLATNFGPEVIGMFTAMGGGIQFAINMDPHNIFDLGPCIDHMRKILAV